jgi:hypothetical protein
MSEPVITETEQKQKCSKCKSKRLLSEFSVGKNNKKLKTCDTCREKIQKKKEQTQTNDVEIKATDEDQAKPVKQKKVKKPLYSELTKTIEALFCDDLDWSNFNTEWTLSVVKVM